MSYTRTFSEPVTFHYSGSVEGKHYSGSVTQRVNVSVHVHTDDFDAATKGNAKSVDSLTAAVIATQQDHVEAVRRNAARIGATLVSGFFSTVRSEISQQAAELSVTVDALTAHLAELAKRCADKKRQMAGDYRRLAARYSKIFDELNRELSHRVAELDRPSFSLAADVDSATSRTATDGSAAATGIATAETASVRSHIQAGLTKRRAADAIASIRSFVTRRREADATLAAVSLPAGCATPCIIPVIAIEATSPAGRPPVMELHAPPAPQIDAAGVMRPLLDACTRRPDATHAALVSSHFAAMLAADTDPADPRSRRLAELTSQLFENASTTIR